MRPDNRAQPSTLGVLFAVLLLLVTVTTVSVAALGALDIEDQTFVGVSVEGTTDAIVVTGQGGETVPTSDLALIVGTDAAERYGVETLTSEERFEPGDSVRLDFTPPEQFGDLLAVRVVHEPSGQTLFADRILVRHASPVEAGPGRPVTTPTVPEPTPTSTATPTPSRTDAPAPTSETRGTTIESVSTTAYNYESTDFVSATAPLSGGSGDERVVFELQDREGIVLDTHEYDDCRTERRQPLVR